MLPGHVCRARTAMNSSVASSISKDPLCSTAALRSPSLFVPPFFTPLIRGVFFNVLARQATLMLLVRFVRSDRKVKARLGKIIFNVSERVAVIVSGRGGLQELSGEESGVAKTKAQPFIQRVFGNQIEFVPNVAAGTWVGGNRNRSAAGVKIVI